MLPMLAWLVVINLYSLWQFKADKQRAIAGARRISEASLLQSAFFGGSIGALAGRSLFRHKTRKEPFATQLQLIAALQAGLLVGWAVY